MSNIPNQSVANLNSVQKGGLFAAAVIFGILVVLHSPWSGYQTESKGFTALGTYFPPSPLEVSYWHTQAPLSHWLGYLTNFLGCAGVLAVVTALGVYLSRTRDQERLSRE